MIFIVNIPAQAEYIITGRKLKHVQYRRAVAEGLYQKPVYFIRPFPVLAQGGGVYLPVYLLGELGAYGTDNLLRLFRADLYIPVLCKKLQFLIFSLYGQPDILMAGRVRPGIVYAAENPLKPWLAHVNRHMVHLLNPHRLPVTEA